MADEVAVREQVEWIGTHAVSGINILLCFAGIVCTEASADVSIDRWRQVLDVNTTGSFICAQAVARLVLTSFSNALSSYPLWLISPSMSSTD